MTIATALVTLTLLSGNAGRAVDPAWATVPGASVVLQYGDAVDVESFQMGTTLVTNREFAAFVATHPQWSKDRVPALFADGTYLSHWTESSTPGRAVRLDAPVTNISWFAARAYCTAHNARLPTMAEWEWAAAASETSTDARRDRSFTQRILDWYSKPTPAQHPAVRSTYKNVHGLWDLHGLVWEWVEDFNAVLTTGASRKDQSLDRGLFCAAGAVGSVDPRDYAAFLRFAMRGSLKGRYGGRGLGFRCARNLP